MEARPALYVELHHKLVEAIESCLHVERVLSIDEVACRLTGSDGRRERALALAHQIKQTVAGRVGGEMRSSIGIAPNVFLAKVASDMEKPDGLVVIEDADLPGCLHGLKLRELCGIGKAMEQRLHRSGIRTGRAIYARPARKNCGLPGAASRVSGSMRGCLVKNSRICLHSAAASAIRMCSHRNCARRRLPCRCCIACCKRRRCGFAATALSQGAMPEKSDSGTEAAGRTGACSIHSAIP